MTGSDDSSTEKAVLHQLVPTYPDDKPIIWDDNDASLGGLIADVVFAIRRSDIRTPHIHSMWWGIPSHVRI